ncbi:MAG: hypothetical protein R2856_27010 [Caldilineaceae bacterium]
MQLPGGQAQTVSCTLEETTPQIFAVSQPYVQRTGNNNARTFTIEGIGFGATQGNGSATLDGNELQVLSWSNTRLERACATAACSTYPVTAPAEIAADSGERTINGLTIHVLQNNIYNPTVYEVGPAAPTPQSATPSTPPKRKTAPIPWWSIPVSRICRTHGSTRGAYYENLIVAPLIKLQGVGPGGFQGQPMSPAR